MIAASLGYSTRGQAALAGIGIGVVVAGACGTGYLLSSRADVDIERFRIEADIAISDAAINSARYAAIRFGDRVSLALNKLLACPESSRNAVQQCIQSYKNRLQSSFTLVYSSNLTRNINALQQVRLQYMERHIPELIRCMESNGCSKQ